MPALAEAANKKVFSELKDIYTQHQINRTSQLDAIRGSEVKLEEACIARIADSHYEDLRNAPLTPEPGNAFTLIMGGNGSGKTSQVLPEILAQKGGAVIICTDSVRPKVAQAFREAQGEGNYQEPLYTQNAARAVSLKCQAKAMHDNLNIIATTVGYDRQGLERILKIIKDNGYAPHLVCAALSPEESVKRLYDRNEQGANDHDYRERQPFQNPSWTLPSSQYPTTPEDVFDEITANPEKHGLASAIKYDTDVPRTEKPKVVMTWHSKNAE